MAYSEVYIDLSGLSQQLVDGIGVADGFAAQCAGEVLGVEAGAAELIIDHLIAYQNIGTLLVAALGRQEDDPLCRPDVMSNPARRDEAASGRRIVKHESIGGDRYYVVLYRHETLTQGVSVLDLAVMVQYLERATGEHTHLGLERPFPVDALLDFSIDGQEYPSVGPRDAVRILPGDRHRHAVTGRQIRVQDSSDLPLVRTLLLTGGGSNLPWRTDGNRDPAFKAITRVVREM